VYLCGESGRNCQWRITWERASLLGTTCYLERLRLFARTRFLWTLSTDSRLLRRLGRLNIWRLGDLVGDDMGHVTSLGFAGVPDQSHEAKRHRILSLKSEPRR